MAAVPEDLYTYQDFVEPIARPQHVAGIVRWLLTTGWIPEFRLVERVQAEEEAVIEGTPGSR